MTKDKYNFKTKSNFNLLCYCAASFTKCWLAMNANGSWIVCATKPVFYSTIGMWTTSKAEDYHHIYFTKLTKRPASFAPRSLIRVDGKGLAWFNDKPTYAVCFKEIDND